MSAVSVALGLVVFAVVYRWNRASLQREQVEKHRYKGSGVQ